MPVAVDVVARLVLAAVFAVAAVGKLIDLAGSKAAMEQFGLPGPVASAAGSVLPAVEGVLAVMLLIDSTARLAALAAAGLLAVFVAAMARLMARGEAAECHCFGALHSAPVGWRTLARNAVLAAVALAAALATRQGAVSGWIAGLHGAGALAAGEGVALALALGAAGAFALTLLRQHGEMLLKIDELEARLDGSSPRQAAARPAPNFSLAGLRGETVTLQSLLAPSRPVMLLFTDPGCGPCQALMPEVARWQSEHEPALTIAVISTGGVEANHAKAAEHALVNVYVQDSRSVSDAYGVAGTPSAVLVGADATITEPVAPGADQIRALLARAIGPTELQVQAVPAPAPVPAAAAPALPAPTLRVGSVAPRRQLVALGGQAVRLGGGRAGLLLVFWNPQCGFCERLESELLSWSQARSKTDVRLVLIAQGPEEANRQLPFRAPVVLDPGGRLMREFGAPGTPSALLIDAHGHVASAMAVGGPDVMALTRSGAILTAAA